jgi:glutamate 5-kinase
MMSRLDYAKRIVIKIGSTLLVDAGSGEIRRPWLHGLADDILRLRGRGQEIILVSSGAVALGRRVLSLARSNRVDEAQAAAAVGQVGLVHAWQEALKPHGVTAAQILLTLDDTERRRRYLNARNTMSTLLSLGVIPVINENDTVATSELRYGDNDRLAARVASMMSADCLVLLSDIDGLYASDPTTDKDAHFYAEVKEITPEIEAMAGTSRTDMGSGGMATKIAAARIAVDAGCHMVIASGRLQHPLRAIAEGARCTWFPARATPVAARKRWIAGSLKPQGALIVDAGAASALAGGRSLLPAGIKAIEGEFERGDAVQIKTLEGEEIARGLAAYDSDEARLLMGHKSSEIETLLGYRGRDEMIHRDDMVFKADKRADKQAGSKTS